MKSVAIGMTGAALVAVLAVPASASPARTPAHPTTRIATTSTTSTWHPPAARAAAHRGTAPTRGPVSTTRLIIRAVEHSGLLGEFTPAQVTVSKVRVSRVDRTWAAAQVTPKNPTLADPADVVLRQSKGTWRALELGTGGVGCDLAPAKVVRSLALACEG